MEDRTMGIYLNPGNDNFRSMLKAPIYKDKTHECRIERFTMEYHAPKEEEEELYEKDGSDCGSEGKRGE